jgi:hypothetical protein
MVSTLRKSMPARLAWPLAAALILLIGVPRAVHAQTLAPTSAAIGAQACDTTAGTPPPPPDASSDGAPPPPPDGSTPPPPPDGSTPPDGPPPPPPSGD